MTTPDTELPPKDQPATTRTPRHRLVIGAAVAALVMALLVVLINVPRVNQSMRFQSVSLDPTDGYNITNNSGAMLVFQSVGGHAGAPLPVGTAWLPGQTLNFEVDDGGNFNGPYTGDAFFEAYTVGAPNDGVDAGTVDVHFNTGPGSPTLNPPMAYLNPADTAPLVASAVGAGYVPMNYGGETWTMENNLDNRIASSASVTYDVTPGWSFEGVSADQLRTSVTTAKDGTCTTPTSTLTNCTLGNTSWSFNWA